MRHGQTITPRVADPICPVRLRWRTAEEAIAVGWLESTSQLRVVTS